MSIRYDESFSALLEGVRQVLGDAALDRTAVLREASGRLTFLYDGSLPVEQIEALAQVLRERLGRYAREDHLVADLGTPGAERLLREPPRQWLPFGERRIRYLDRRVVGADWLAGLAEEAPAPPRFVFASLKGGVGRTSAICVAAAELARTWKKNVLVVDLDLEAPGLGTLLLREGDAPPLGALDFFVESTLAAPSADLIRDLVGQSFLTQADTGRVAVVPAVGTATRPEEFLGKLARAMLDQGPDDVRLPVRDKAARLLAALTADTPYDVVLIDARAGLAELAAGPLLGLGAMVLLFGTAQRQTLEDCRFLLSHLASLIPPESESPWRRLKMVMAKAPPDRAQQRWFKEEIHTLFQDYVYEELEGLEGFNFTVDDEDAPHHPVPIAMNPLFASWDPARRQEDLDRSFYEGSFRKLLDFLELKLGVK